MTSFDYANASALTDRLWVGGDLEIFDEPLAEAQLAELVDAGLTHMIDVRLEWDDIAWVAARHPDVDYTHLGVADAGQRMDDAWFDAGIEVAEQALGDDANRLLVHCHMGINRGPSMAFAILLHQGWDPVDALERLHEVRPIAFVAYAEDAVDWWVRREGGADAERAAAQDRVARWRRSTDRDLEAVIRRIRVRGD